jgi:hypothetical protein
MQIGKNFGIFTFAPSDCSYGLPAAPAVQQSARKYN